VCGRLGAVSGTLQEFGVAEGIKKDLQPSKLLMQLKATLNPKYAKTFELDRYLEKLFQACFHGDVFKMHCKKVKTWGWFLIASALIVRASDVTTHCPLIEDLDFPDDPQDLTLIGQLMVKFVIGRANLFGLRIKNQNIILGSITIHLICDFARFIGFLNIGHFNREWVL
jgi:hypothetical protein